MIKKIFSLLILIILSISITVRADDKCSKSEMNRLKDLASKIEFSYDYEIKENKNNEESWKTIDFSITAINLTDELKTMIIYDMYSGNYREFTNNNEHKKTLKGFHEGEKVNITIKAFTNNDCSYQTVLTKTINLPYVNSFYDNDLCQEIKDFKYCTELTEKRLTSKEYYDELNDYYLQKSIQEIIETEEGSNVKKNYTIIIIIAIGVIVVATILILLFKKRKKDVL